MIILEEVVASGGMQGSKAAKHMEELHSFLVALERHWPADSFPEKNRRHRLSLRDQSIPIVFQLYYMILWHILAHNSFFASQREALGQVIKSGSRSISVACGSHGKEDWMLRFAGTLAQRLGWRHLMHLMHPTSVWRCRK